MAPTELSLAVGRDASSNGASAWGCSGKQPPLRRVPSVPGTPRKQVASSWGFVRSCALVCAGLAAWTLGLHVAFPHAYAPSSAHAGEQRSVVALDVGIEQALLIPEDSASASDLDATEPPPTPEEIIAEGNSWDWVEPRVGGILGRDDDTLRAHFALHAAPGVLSFAAASDEPAGIPAALAAALAAQAPTLSLNVHAHADNFTSDAVLAGDPKIILRDSVPIQRAYEELGLSVSLATEVGIKQKDVAFGTLASVRHRPWAVILCTTTRTERCVSEEDFLQLERRRRRGRFTRINWLAGLEQVLWSKDAMCATTAAAGAWQPTFSFACWVLPTDAAALTQVLAERQRAGVAQQRGAWIAKPYKKGGGIGIFVLDNDREMRRVMASPRRELIVQPYLYNPHLIEGRKWDVRAYALVTSVTPFTRVFMFEDGLVRLASGTYDATARHGGQRTQFLTNTSVNKRKVKDMSLLTWPFARLRDTLGAAEYDLLWSRMKRATAMLFVAAEARFAEHYAAMEPGFRCAGCYHLIGVDLMVDQDLFPRVVEVNGEPNMALTGATDSHYDGLKIRLQRETSRIALEPLHDLANLTAAHVAQLGLDAEELEALADDAEAVEYLLQLRRELAHAEGFRVIYPDPEACDDNQDRAAVWDDFIETVLGGDALRDTGRRKMLHKIATRFVCAPAQ